MNTTIAKKVFVGLSGGVDSSVSAAMLKAQGYDVTGVYIKTWQPDWLVCTWREERRDAMRVAAHLDIPFLTFDFENEYKQKVADYMIEEYRLGRTPNPDIMCNKEIKFGSFLNKAKEMGAHFIATGHYAQNIENTLYQSTDVVKDQSYFLWTLTPEVLRSVLFPVGHLQKKEVRVLAQKYNLPTADKKDSQGICFLGKIDVKEFLKHYIEEKPGNILNEKREVVGTHTGALFYTIGERHGLNISKKTSHDAPCYVISKNIHTNELVVAERGIETSHMYGAHGATLKNVQLSIQHGADFTLLLEVRIRYRQQKQKAVLTIKNKVYNVKFDVSQEGLSVGQSIVFYKNTVCMGGGIIDSVIS